MMIKIDKSKRWPIVVFIILFTTVSVNFAFAWVAISDYGGGFELVNQDDDSSYKPKVSLGSAE